MIYKQISFLRKHDPISKVLETLGPYSVFDQNPYTHQYTLLYPLENNQLVVIIMEKEKIQQLYIYKNNSIDYKIK